MNAYSFEEDGQKVEVENDLEFSELVAYLQDEKGYVANETIFFWKKEKGEWVKQ